MEDGWAVLGVQIVAATVAGAVLFLIASGSTGVQRGWRRLCLQRLRRAVPGGYGLVAAAVTEIVLTGIFVYIILGPPTTGAEGLRPIAIGLGADGIHLVGIPVTNLSVNPAARWAWPGLPGPRR